MNPYSRNENCEDRVMMATQSARANLADRARGNYSRRRMSLNPLRNRIERRMRGQLNDSRRLFQQIYALENEVQREEQRLRQAEQHIKQTEHHLENCRAQIFRSLPTYEVTDARISEELNGLRANLANWVEELPDLNAFTDAFWNALSDLDVFPLNDPWPHSWSVEHISAQTEIITKIIFSHLFSKLFTVLLPAMPSEDKRLVLHLQRGMGGLEPKKDTKTVGYWRSDTIRAYTACPQYQERVKTHCSQISYDICDILRTLQFATPSNWQHKLTKFEEQIVNPAAKLAILMRSSPEEYRWEWYGDLKWDSQAVVCKRVLKWATILDIQIHNRVSMEKLNELSDDAKIGNLVLVMHPALFRCGRDGQKDIIIAKPVIAIHAQDRQPMVKVEVNEEEKSPDLNMEGLGQTTSA